MAWGPVLAGRFQTCQLSAQRHIVHWFIVRVQALVSRLCVADQRSPSSPTPGPGQLPGAQAQARLPRASDSRTDNHEVRLHSLTSLSMRLESLCLRTDRCLAASRKLGTLEAERLIGPRTCKTTTPTARSSFAHNEGSRARKRAFKGSRSRKVDRWMTFECAAPSSRCCTADAGWLACGVPSSNCACAWCQLSPAIACAKGEHDSGAPLRWIVRQ
jgi:hypothetical protein